MRTILNNKKMSLRFSELNFELRPNSNPKLIFLLSFSHVCDIRLIDLYKCRHLLYN